MSRRAIIVCLALAVALAAWPADQKKKKKKSKKDEEPITQVLELPKDPPAAIVADTDRLVFQVSPLSSKGLLSQQLRDALKWLLRQNRPVVRLRAYIAGTGDTRRVQSVVSEAFTDKKLALPVLSVVQIGSLPLDGAQVLLEAVTVDKKSVNPAGLAFIASQQDYVAQPVQPVLPLAEKAAAQLRAALDAAGAAAQDVLRVSCSVTSLDDAEKVRLLFASRYPSASLIIMQPLRGALQSGAACGAVARLASAPQQPLEFRNPAGVDRLPGSSAIALVGPHRVAFSSAQLAFGTGAEDARLAFQRLGKSIEQANASFQNAAVAEVYSLSSAAGDRARSAAAEFFDKARPPVLSTLPFEGLPSMDASFAIDLIALLPEPTQEIH